MQLSLRLSPPAPCRSGARRRSNVLAAQQRQEADTGISLLTWTSKLLPQSALVTGVKTSWAFAWRVMVRELAPQSKSGAYVRPSYAFGGRIGDGEFPVESGRYHLYLGNACPWCHRVLLTLALRGLAGHISYSRLLDEPEHATRGGWVFGRDEPDPVFGAKDLWEVYDNLSPGFRGRCTAPLLVDKLTKRPVSNESADICRMLNDLTLPGCSDVELYPKELQPEIDEINDLVYRSVANGVYRSGFSTSQAAYDAVQRELYAALDQLEQRLQRQRFLVGEHFTEADLRLFPAIVRFDAVYSGIFRCVARRVSDYPALSGWMKDVWQLKVDGSTLQVCDTIDIEASRRSYYTNLFPLNPSGILPMFDVASLGLDSPPGRGDSEPFKRRLPAALPALQA